MPTTLDAFRAVIRGDQVQVDPATGRATLGGAELRHRGWNPLFGIASATIPAAKAGLAFAAGQQGARMIGDTRALGLTSTGVGAGGTSGVTAPGGGGFLGELAGVGLDWLRDQVGGGGGSGGSGLVPQQCPPGNVRVGDRCVSPGDAFPGGAPFITPAGGVAVNGGGLAQMLGARTPAVVGQINGNPIRRCPRSWVLGADNNCYHRKVLPRAFRKWAPAKKAKISAYDWKMMNRYGPGGSKQAKVKDMATAAGYTCSSKVKRPKVKKKRKR